MSIVLQLLSNKPCTNYYIALCIHIEIKIDIWVHIGLTMNLISIFLPTKTYQRSRNESNIFDTHYPCNMPKNYIIVLVPLTNACKIIVVNMFPIKIEMTFLF